MDNETLAGVALVALLATPFLAHAAGRLAHAAVRTLPGRARPTMPTLAAGDMGRGLEATERRVLAALRGGGQGIDPRALAAREGLDPSLVEAVFSRIRAAVPVRLRVTASGRLLHDIAADDVARLARARLLRWPGRVGLLAVVALANAGAAWPLAMSALIGAVTLGQILSAKDEEGVIEKGILGLLLVGVTVGLTIGLGWLSDKVLTPLVSGPRTLRDSPAEEAADVGKKSRRGRRRSGDEPEDGSWKADPPPPRKPLPWHLRKGSRTPDPGSFLAFTVVVLVIAVIGASLAGIAIWVRGLWRSIARRDDAGEDVSPSDWVRARSAPDVFERFVPTNDLVSRAIRALRRLLRGRPADVRMASRLLAFAASRVHTLSSLDVMLREGLDRDEAVAVTARLHGEWGGRVLAAGTGDLVVALPPDAASGLAAGDSAGKAGTAAAAAAPPGPEALLPASPGGVPVNVPGLRAVHLKGLSRLVGGSLLAALACIALVLDQGGDTFPAPLAGLLVAATGLVLGTSLLASVVRYAVRASAGTGVLRDIRRLTLAAVRDALARGDRSIDIAPLIRDIEAQARVAWPSIDPSAVRAEVEVALVDLDLAPSDAAGAVFDLRPLADRMAAVERAAREVPRDVPPPADDAVVFDTAGA